ncbi:MAG: S1 RNA-binding domain-containing protein, partial [Chloroflexota bacterium]
MTEITKKPSSMDELESGMALTGRIKRIELFGAFVDVGVGHDGLLHISQLGRPNVRNVEDVVKVGEEVTVYVLRVEKETGRIALSLEQPPAVSWDTIQEGGVVTGKVVRLEKFGVFVDIGAERPGMIHVSELASGYVNSPSDVVKVGDEVQARIIKVNKKKHRIDLSLKAMEE